MPSESLHELVDRIRRETLLRVSESYKRIEQTQDNMCRVESRRSFYEDGIRKTKATLARLNANVRTLKP